MANPQPNQDLAERIWAKLSIRLADIESGLLSQEELALLRETVVDVENVVELAIAGDAVEAQRAKKDIDAQLAHFGAIEVSRLQSAFWGTVKDVLAESLGFIIHAVV